MRRASAAVSLFVAGIIIGFLMLRAFERRGEPSSQEAKFAIQVLDRKALAPDVSTNRLVSAAARIEPAVVSLDTISFRRSERYYYPGTQEGSGSGVIISPNGYIVTNYHVVAGATYVNCTMMDGKKYQARLVGADPESDIAVIKIDGTGFPTAELGDSDVLKVGEDALAVGNPLSVGTTVTHGIISATDRKDLPVGNGRILKQAIQTDAPINPGNSGGALANIAGQLIGINTAIRSETGTSAGIGFAIPVNAVRSIIKRLINGGSIKPREVPFIGVMIQQASPEIAARIGVRSALMIEVYPHTPADKAGLVSGTIVAKVDGKRVTTSDEMRKLIMSKAIGSRIELTVLRGDGSSEVVPVTVGGRLPDESTIQR